MEAAADDTSETQSHAHADLLWDHAGDVESDPLLGGDAGSLHNPLRPETVQLSFDQAQELLKVLDNTRYVLETFVNQVQDGGVGNAGGIRSRRSWWAQHCFPARRRLIARYIFIITATLQAVNLLVVSMIDVWPRRDDQSVMIGTGITMILLQVVNLFFIVMVSIRLLRQLYKHSVNIFLLGQSYVATLLLFAGIYTLTYRMKPRSWKFIQEELEQDPILVIVLYSKFLFFSVSTATLCGSDNVLPKDWYNCLFTAVQMLMSFVYFASILGQTLSQDTQYWLGVGPGEGGEATRGRSQSATASAARVTGLTTQVWRNYGSRSNTPAIRSAGGDGTEGLEDGTDRESRQHTVAVDIETGRHSINLPTTT